MRRNLLEISHNIGRKEITSLIQTAISEVAIDQDKNFVQYGDDEIFYDTNYLNDLLKNTTSNINERLSDTLSFPGRGKNLAYRFEVSIGLAYNNAFMSHFGPSIPVLYELMGDFKTSLSTTVDSFGINNAVIKLLMNISFQTQVILPFVGDKVEFNYEAPIAINIIKGDVPFNITGSEEIAGVNSIQGSYSKL